REREHAMVTKRERRNDGRPRIRPEGKTAAVRSAERRTRLLKDAAPTISVAASTTPPVTPSPPAAAGPTLGEVRLRAAAVSVEKSVVVIERQRLLVFEMRRNGVDTTQAEKLLRTFQDVLLEQRKFLATLENRHRRGLD